MSSSSDIEKLFDHFGGDAGAYQEIGRENEACVARTRWPLLVTLDLTQPRIPAVTSVTSKHDAAAQGGEPDASAQQAADAPTRHADAKHTDSAQPGRTRPPLFARAHRRDIPPVSAAPPAVPSGAARFGTAHDVAQGEAAREAQAISYANAVAAERSEAATAAATTTPVAPSAHFTQAASNPPPVSILGKLFTPAEPAPATSSPHLATPAPAPLHAVFDRLRGNPVAGAPGAPASTPRSATLSPAAAPHSWLINGPRRS